jgi:hypothetical protein
VEPQKLALTSPISGGLSVGMLCSWTKAKEFVFCFGVVYHVFSYTALYNNELRDGEQLAHC